MALDSIINFVSLIEGMVACRAGATLDYSLLRPLSGELIPLLEALTNIPPNWRTPAVFVLCETAEKINILFRKYIDFVTYIKPYSRNINFS